MSDARRGPSALDSDATLTTIMQRELRAGLFYQDHVSGEHLWSKTLLDLLHLPSNWQVSAEAFLKIVHPEDFSQVMSVVGDALGDAGQSRYEIEFRARRGDGQWRRMRAISHVERDEAGLVTLEQGIVQDLGEA